MRKACFIVGTNVMDITVELAGLFAGNPKRRTSQPTTERLLQAFSEVILRSFVLLASHNSMSRPFRLFSNRFCPFGFSSAAYLQLLDDARHPPEI